jgi:hypothetical protein
MVLALIEEEFSIINFPARMKTGPEALATVLMLVFGKSRTIPMLLNGSVDEGLKSLTLISPLAIGFVGVPTLTRLIRPPEFDNVPVTSMPGVTVVPLTLSRPTNVKTLVFFAIPP